MVKAFILLAGLFSIGAPLRSGLAADGDFFKGKTIRIIVGFAAGGGFDQYSRIIARHMPKHIPGSPAMIVDNMTGAGSRVAANYLYKAAAPDGLAIGNFIGSLLLQQILGDTGVEFDGKRFEWVGAPVQDETVCALTKASGVTNLDQWIASKRPIKLGGEATEGVYCTIPGTPPDRLPAGKDFVDRFTKQYGQIVLFSPNSYDAASVLIDAMKRADSTDPAKYLSALAQTSYQGVTGKIEFDDKGDIKNGAVTVYQVMRGKLEPVATVGGGEAVAASAAPAAK